MQSLPRCIEVGIGFYLDEPTSSAGNGHTTQVFHIEGTADRSTAKPAYMSVCDFVTALATDLLERTAKSLLVRALQRQ